MKSTFVADLRRLADFYEVHPDFPQPSFETVNVFVGLKGELVDAARQLGSCDKYLSDDWFELQRAFGDIKLCVNARRLAVCEKVQVGTKVIPEQLIPAKEEELIPARAEEVIPEHEEPIYEWKCPGALLSGGGENV